ncbi:MAG: hypothetical protein JNK43_02215 [Ignavibacteria bacterium]|nr:hypothetical protein [Ignavibacteria bacterium]
MKKLFILLLLGFTFSAFSQGIDTTIRYDLNFDREEESIRVKYNESAQEFTLKINNDEFTGKYSDAYDVGVEIIDINRNDNLREVLVKGYGPSDQSDMYFFQYVNGKITQCGRLPSNFGIEVTGNGKLTEYAWMGFWTAKIRYEFDSKNKSITKIEDEFYDVNQECEVRTSFDLLMDKNDNSEVTVKLKPGTKLTLVKADISQNCPNPEDIYTEFYCDWFLIKTSDGKQGWCRLKNFHEKVDGLVWAG